MDDFSKKLAEAISTSGLYQKDAAHLLGLCSEQIISRWITGRRSPPEYLQESIIEIISKHLKLEAPLNFSEYLRCSRSNFGLTQKEMSEKLKVPYSSYYSWENNLYRAQDYIKMIVAQRLESLKYVS